MKPQWENQIGILENALLQLSDLGKRLPATFTIQGVTVTTDALEVSLKQVIEITKTISNSEEIDPILLAIHQNNIVNVCNQISQVMSSLSSNQQGVLEQLANYIWSLRSSLVWLIHPKMPENYFNLIKSTDLIGKIESTEVLYKKLLEALEKIVDYKNLDEQIKNFINAIQGYEREASNAKTNAESSASQALSNKETIQELLTKLESGESQQKELREKINSLAEQASLVFEGNSKAGLAKSFASRRESLEKSLTYWKYGFFIGICLLILGIFLTTTGYINLTPLIKADGTIDAWSVLARILLTGPAIWFTWFVARQYSHTMRLIEDYAFKEASALAFVGYKREMGEDAEMIKLLRETAIRNFGSPPTRMLSISEPSSPLHELIDSTLHKGKIDKLIEILKALNPIKETKS